MGTILNIQLLERSDNIHKLLDKGLNQPNEEIQHIRSSKQAYPLKQPAILEGQKTAKSYQAD